VDHATEKFCGVGLECQSFETNLGILRHQDHELRNGVKDMAKAPAKQSILDPKNDNEFHIESVVERVLFGGRWMLAPLYVGLLLSLLPIVYRFFIEFIHLMQDVAVLEMKDITLKVLELLDVVLLGNLIIIVIFAGYENFVSRINVAKNSVDRPHWMGRVDYSGLKIKLIGSLVAISVIELLKDFMMEGDYDDKRQMWRIIIHMTFVVSGVLFALMDLLADKRESVDLSEQPSKNAK
jgi:uncharacterized protein (TIGR00645 family)